MRRKSSNDQGLQGDLAEALKRLITILARQAAREAMTSTPPSITESTDEDQYATGE
jgi:hypothetical protein